MTFFKITMFCPECGENNKDDAIYCLNCGTQIPQRSQQQQRQSPQPSPQEGPRYQQPNYQQGQPAYRPPPGFDPRLYQKEPNFLHYFCSLCFPIGIIFYLDFKEDNEQAAYNIGIITVVGFVLFLFSNAGFL